MSIRRLYVYGAGGMGREVFELARTVNAAEQRWDWIGFVDDISTTAGGSPVAGTGELLLQSSSATDVAMGITDPAARRRLVTYLAKNRCLHFPVLVHPQAYVSPGALLSQGVIIQWGCWVSTDVVLADFSFLNVACCIGHDVSIGKYTSLMTTVDLGGHVQVGDCCYFGAKSTVVPGIRIGGDARIGAGSLVVQNVADGLTVMGNPARTIDHRP
jgi:sugar O-acyltransferase (sialic acid O-acetyltransferase NeuD family)